MIHDDGQARFYLGDVCEVLRQLPERSVHCAVTSPPYWGLRDYGTATWEGGDEGCDHQVGGQVQDSKAPGAITTGQRPGVDASVCRKCGAKRIDQQLGLEPTPEEYVARMVEVFREVKRVLRDDGTLWLNIGDCYNSSPSNQLADRDWGDGVKRDHYISGRMKRDIAGLKPKDLVGIPWMLAFALRADGWYLRSDIIWAKPNPMPESVTDRPTKAHEYLFLLSKRERYYYDADAIREAHSREWWHETPSRPGNPDRNDGGGRQANNESAGRNKRTVWTIATQPYPEAHFATYPTDLVEPCILAGTSEHGVCSECGAPWERVVEKEYLSPIVTTGTEEGRYTAGRNRNVTRMGDGVNVTTTGWRPTCKHEAPVTAPTVLDPFLGSGTTAYVAKKLGRRAIGIDLNEKYLQLAMRRCAQMGLIFEEAR